MTARANSGAVQVRLVGKPGAVAAVLSLLEQAQVTGTPRQLPARRAGHVRVYLTVIRRYPATGGPR
ncbi:hypothetical protein F4553_005373 [Allocatelliglobosispora scoriae]|uniref:ACT domain-containing protein n=1 Tax=Allocatelliglobosispora scoriae TaxID=643052 RepID=A0A841BUW7_9ACTN|nr:hypothetical protein [Allocatelliglobosispora scoriae]MBB5871994.1 hypothetical protein [Allocatelliglobosispora scoriae]